MSFENKIITGNGLNQVVLTNAVTTEAAVNGLVAYNTTGADAEFRLFLDGDMIIIETVPANGSYRIPDKINIPVNTILSATADAGVNLTVSALQQSIDTNAALNSAQQSALDASNNADRAENALPAGTIDDSTPAADKAYSSNKVEELATLTVDETGFDLDWASDDVLKFTATADFAFTFSNLPTVGMAIVEIKGGGDWTPTYPTQVVGDLPVLASGTETTVLGFYTSNGIDVIVSVYKSVVAI